MASKALLVALVLAAAAQRGCVPAIDGNRALEAAGAPAAPSHDAGVTTSPAGPSPASGREVREERCASTSDVHLFVAPSRPVVGTALRVLAVTDRPIGAELVVTANGIAEASSRVRRGGPPYFWIAEVPSPRAATYSVSLAQPACPAGTEPSRSILVDSAPAAATSTVGASVVWPTQAEWSRAFENVYSAWLEALFDAPEDAMPSWPALHDVLRDPKRNLLFDYLGAGEDSIDPPIERPDCADLPYFLRAYFAFKLGLPFGISECDRGRRDAPPRCKRTMATNENPPRAGVGIPASSPARRFGAFLRTIADRAHSGSARVPLDDEVSDYYPVPISAESLRPGTVYADPYGHVLMIARRVPQTAERSGVLFAVDAQPDGTVRRKRFWRGNFLYANERALGGVGWKRFRPMTREGPRLVRLGDAAIEANPEYGDVWRDGATLNADAFFDAMDDVLAPQPVEPRRALLDGLAELEEQVETRVDSVDDARAWLATAHAPVPMPDLAELFETTGTWEDLSTPSRDLRLLVAIDFVTGLPAHVARRSSRYAVPIGKPDTDIMKELDDLLARELSTRTIAYRRSDDSSFTLTLADVLGRKLALEMGYNPNDCPEVRWGASPGSDEGTTCRSRAPAEQERRMQAVRAWFHERRRPPRR